MRAEARQKKQEEAEHAAWTNLRLKEKESLRTKDREREKVSMIRQWIVVAASQPKPQQEEEEGAEQLQDLSQGNNI
jgi:hypothetical protein